TPWRSCARLAWMCRREVRSELRRLSDFQTSDFRLQTSDDTCGSQVRATLSRASVCIRQPTNWTAHGIPADVRPDGIEIAGWPVTLKSCVSRSIRFLTGSVVAPASTELAPSR